MSCISSLHESMQGSAACMTFHNLHRGIVPLVLHCILFSGLRWGMSYRDTNTAHHQYWASVRMCTNGSAGVGLRVADVQHPPVMFKACSLYALVHILVHMLIFSA